MSKQAWVINASPLILMGKLDQLDLPAARPLVQQLVASGSYLSANLISAALHKVGEFQ